MKIGELSKNSVEKLVFQIKEFKGKTFIDVRIFFLNDKGEFSPTKKGIIINPDIAEEALTLFKKAVDELTKSEAGPSKK